MDMFRVDRLLDMYRQEVGDTIVDGFEVAMIDRFGVEWWAYISEDSVMEYMEEHVHTTGIREDLAVKDTLDEVGRIWKYTRDNDYPNWCTFACKMLSIVGTEWVHLGNDLMEEEFVENGWQDSLGTFSSLWEVRNYRVMAHELMRDYMVVVGEYAEALWEVFLKEQRYTKGSNWCKVAQQDMVTTGVDFKECAERYLSDLAESKYKERMEQDVLNNIRNYALWKAETIYNTARFLGVAEENAMDVVLNLVHAKETDDLLRDGDILFEGYGEFLTAALGVFADTAKPMVLKAADIVWDYHPSTDLMYTFTYYMEHKVNEGGQAWFLDFFTPDAIVEDFLTFLIDEDMLESFHEEEE